MVSMPLEFQGLSSCIVVSGLIPTSDNVVCDLTKSTNSVVLSEFQGFTTSLVLLRIRAKNPKVTTTSQASIKSTLPNGNVIDLNLAAGTMGPFTPHPDTPLITQETYLKLGQTGPLECFFGSHL